MERELITHSRRAFLTVLATTLPSAAFAEDADWTPRDFHPIRASKPMIGLATYYGARENGHRTASGEIFHALGYSAAHRLLPFGTFLKVTHIDNGRCVVVKVNDRGPYNSDCIIDLSEGAARELDMCRAGRVRVNLTIIG